MLKRKAKFDTPGRGFDIAVFDVDIDSGVADLFSVVTVEEDLNLFLLSYIYGIKIRNEKSTIRILDGGMIKVLNEKSSVRIFK